MTPVLGKLPDEVVRAGAAWDKAYVALVKANATWGKAEHYAAALVKAIQDYAVEIEALHAIEHPGCPWDGHSLFGGEK